MTQLNTSGKEPDGIIRGNDVRFNEHEWIISCRYLLRFRGKRLYFWISVGEGKDGEGHQTDVPRGVTEQDALFLKKHQGGLLDGQRINKAYIHVL